MRSRKQWILTFLVLCLVGFTAVGCKLTEGDTSLNSSSSDSSQTQNSLQSSESVDDGNSEDFSNENEDIIDDSNEDSTPEDSSSEVHTHQYTSKVTRPKCTKQGFTTYTCACGDSYVDDYTDAVGHWFSKYVSDDNATCEKDSTKTAKCGRGCGATDTQIEEGTKLGHLFRGYTSNRDATCTHDGTQTATCKRLGCSATDTKIHLGSKLSHVFTNYTPNGDATCTQDGTETATCDGDGCQVTDTRTDVDSKTEHSYSHTVTVTKPTCTTQGFTTYGCVCGASYVGDYTDIIPHVYENEVVAPMYWRSNATCTQQASYYYSCDCGAKGSEWFSYGPLTEHLFAEDVWNYSATHHFHPSLCGCDLWGDEAEHVDVDGFCSVCDMPTRSTIGVLYEVSADGTYAEVVGYKGSSSSVIISELYKSLPVTGIAENAFKEKNIGTVVIPEGVTHIGASAFYECRVLKHIEIPKSLKSISTQAFYRCTALEDIYIADIEAWYQISGLMWLTGICKDWKLYLNNQLLTELVISEDVEIIKDIYFKSCTSLTSVVIGGNVKGIDEEAFAECINLTSVVIGDGVTYINSSAFAYCNGLTSVVIGDGVTNIGNHLFAYCMNLTSIEFAGTVAQWDAITKGVYWNSNLSVTEIVCSDGTAQITKTTE